MKPENQVNEELNEDVKAADAKFHDGDLASNNDEDLGTESESANKNEKNDKNDENGHDQENDKDIYKDKFYYLAAEFENAKKRFEREKSNIIKYGLESTLKELVEVVDNFERSLDAISKDKDEKVQGIVTGIEMVRNQFLEVLKKQGLEPVEAVDKEFDPNFHEALSQVESPDHKAGFVVSQFQRGYVLNGRLLRAAKVVVSK